jgi:hypothetical protein
MLLFVSAGCFGLGNIIQKTIFLKSIKHCTNNNIRLDFFNLITIIIFFATGHQKTTAVIGRGNKFDSQDW